MSRLWNVGCEFLTRVSGQSLSSLGLSLSCSAARDPFPGLPTGGLR